MLATSARPSCPGCGIAVTPGYQRCPKCHAELPSSVRMSRIDTGGATTIAPIDGPAARWPWYVAGLAVLAGAVAVIALGSRDEKPRPALPDDPVGGEEAVEPEVAGAVDEAPPTAPARAPDPGPAADRLARLLAGVRLYATVEPVGDTVEIRSAYCDDARIGALVADVAGDLRAAGVVTVSCRAVHGAEAWTKELP